MGALAVDCDSQSNSYRLSMESIDGRTVLIVNTVDILPCLGYSIRNTVQWHDDTVVVILSGFIRAIPCIQGPDPASARIFVLRKTSENLLLNIRESEFSDLWKISHDDEGFHAVPVNRSFTSFNQ